MPRGCAIFHVPVQHQALIRSSLPTSHGFEPAPVPGRSAAINNPLPPSDKSAFVRQFEFVGTVDNAPYLCVPRALQFRQDVCGGEDAITRYCTDLAREGGELVAKGLGTEVLDNAERTLTQCCFATVRLPLTVGTGADQVDEAHAPAVTQWISRTLVERHHTFMAVVFYAGAWWVRLSGMIYLATSDFDWAAGVLREVCELVRTGEYREKHLQPRL